MLFLTAFQLQWKQRDEEGEAMKPHSHIRKQAFRSFGQATGNPAPGDAAKVREFYDGLLAWEFRELSPEGPEEGMPGHTGLSQERGGGMYMESAAGGAGSRPPYFQVDDLDAVAARV